MAGQQRTRGMGIQNWLTLLLLLILLPLVALQGYRYYALYQEKQEEALQANLEMARSIAKSFESFVQDVLRQELAIGLAITSSAKMTPGDIIRLLETSGSYPAVRDFTWLNPEGKAVYSNNPALIGADFSDRDYVRDVIGGREWAVGELVAGKIYGKPVFGISRGIRDGRGNLLGVIFAAIVPDKLDSQLAFVRGKGGGISLVDGRGMLVYRYPAIDATWEERNRLRQYPEYEEVFKGKEISRTFLASYEGKDRLVSIVPVPSIGWAASAGQGKEDVTGPIIQSLVRDAVLFLSVSLIAFLIAAALSRKITNPIEALRTYASSLGDGETPNKVEVGNVSELEDLTGSFNAMAEKVQLRETTLQESEERFRSVLESASDIQYRRNVQSDRFDYVSPSVEKVIGYTPAEITAMSPAEALSLIHPDDLPVYRTAMVRLEETGEVEVEYRQRARDGKYHWLSNRMTFVRDTAGNPLYRLGSIRDVTDRKRTEELLTESEQRFRAFVIASSDVVYRMSPDWSEMHQLQGRAFLADTNNPTPTWLQRYIHPDDQPHVTAAIRHAIQTKSIFEMEHRVLRADGTMGWAFSRAVPLMNNKGEIIEWFGAASDITERKRMEEELRKAKDEMEERVTERTYELYLESLYSRNLIEASPDPLVTISADGKITDVNRSTEDVTGVAREKLIGSDFSDYFTEPEKARSGYEEVFRRGHVRDYPLELKHRDGHVTPVLYNASLYRDETGNVLGVFAAARDVTERKRAEAAARAERQRLYDVLETLPVYAILLTPDYHVSFANRFFRERFGKDSGRRCYEYLFERTEPCEVCETYTVRRTGKPHHWEWKGPDGRVYDIHDFPFMDVDGSPLILEVGIDITKRKEAEAALRRLASELAMAEERERKRIAGVLHDEIAQTMAAAKMRMDLITGIPPGHEQFLMDAKALLAQAIRETRALMNAIGNPLLFDMGVKAACESLADQLMEIYPVRIRCDIQDQYKHTDPDVKAIVFQAVRELLNNAMKHSKAQHVHVLLDMVDGFFRVRVTDDGEGFDPGTIGLPTVEGGYGLYSIRERLMAIEGSLQIESTPGRGTTVTAILPAVLDSLRNAEGKSA